MLLRYALSEKLLDIPNNRSSHSVPTPRGGGMAIVVTFYMGLLLLTRLVQLELSMLVGLIGAGALVAAVGFIDDHRHIAAPWRLLTHFIAAGWILFWLGGLPPLISGLTMVMTLLGYLLAAFYLVWLLNLYNFMDGIDGIASIEAMTVCLGGVVLYWLVDPSGVTWMEPALLFAAVAGFLIWNFPRAKIFMGDVGSGFLGLMIGAFSVQAAWVEPMLFWGWLILLGGFVVDATVTLIRRILHGEPFYNAHSSHAYQNVSRKYQSHVLVSLAFGAVNLFWLFPIAAFVAVDWLDGVVGIIIAYTPLVFLALLFKAGAGKKKALTGEP